MKDRELSEKYIDRWGSIKIGEEVAVFRRFRSKYSSKAN